MNSKIALCLAVFSLAVSGCSLFLAWNNRADAQGISQQVYQEILDEVWSEVKPLYATHGYGITKKPETFGEMVQPFMRMRR